MPTLYVATAGASIRRVSRRLVVAVADAVLQSIRLRDLERVVFWGPVQVTTPALMALLENRIETTFLTAGGKLLGRLVPPGQKNVFLRTQQCERHRDLAFRLQVGRNIVATKARNARRVLQLYARSRPGLEIVKTLRVLKETGQRVQTATTLSQLMGYEGEAAAAYFSAYGRLFLAMSFETRSRRPPRDPANALLSLGYTLLTSEATGAAAANGLDPDVGFLHELNYGRPSLALDLVEPFRHPVVDRLALSLINRRVLQEGDFEQAPEGGFILRDDPRRRFFRLYEKIMTTSFRGCDQRPTTYRLQLQDQAHQLANTIMGRGEFCPFRLS